MIKSIRQKLILFLLVTTCTYNATSQNATNNESYGLNKVVPASPNAAALGKYGESPVSLYTGIPSISIPVYEINEGRIKLPITLSYHAGGIRVEEVASWAGLGWSMSGGASITRTVKGLPDEGNPSLMGSGYFNELNDYTVKTVIDSASKSLWWKNQVAYRLTKLRDGEPDIFTVSAGGFSGKFFYSQEEQRFFSVPASNLKIQKIDNPGGGSFYFIVTDEAGLVYTFDVVETNRVFDYYPNISDQEIDFPTSWFLSSITDPVTNKSVSFTYQNVALSYETMKSEVQYYGLDQGYFLQNRNVNINRLSAVRLTNIYFGNGNHIDFITQSSSRQDLVNDKALQYIKVFNGSREIKRVELKHSYFQSANLPEYSADVPNIQTYAKRLKLDSLIEIDPSANVAAKRYAFGYNPYTLPNRLSYAQDLWGFCNGQTNYPSLIPSANFYSGAGYINIPGANRNINPGASQACMLNKIVYPTGGHTEFEYENNTIPYTQDPYDKIQKAYSVSQDPLNPALLLEMPLEVNEPEGHAWITFNVNFDIDNYNAYQPPVPPFVVTIVNTATNTQVVFQEGPFSSLKNIPNGVYTVKVDFTQNPYPNTYAESNIVGYWMGAPPPRNFSLVGGLRIKKMKDFDHITNGYYNVQEYYYTEDNEDALPTGRIRARAFPDEYVVETRPMNSPSNGNVHTCLKRSQYSQYPLSGAGGGIAEYQSVIVIKKGDNTNIKTVVDFFGLADYPDDILAEHDGNMFKPMTLYDHFRGFEKEKREYEFTQTGYKLVKKTKFEYSNLDGVRTKSSFGLTGGWRTPFENVPVEVAGESYLDVGYVPYMGIYKVVSDKLVLTGTVEKSYTKSGEELTHFVKHTINPKNFGISQSISLTSAGDTLIDKITYPLDYTSNLSGHSGWLSGIVGLSNANMNNEVVEKTRFIKKGNTSKLVNAAVTLFNNTLQPGKIVTIDNSALTNYSLSYVANNSLVLDSRLTDKLLFPAYDGNGNILTQQKVNNTPVSYVWGYDNTYPIAEVVNAQNTDIASTSFEPYSAGNWSIGGVPALTAGTPTGQYAYSVSGGLSKSSLSASKVYVVSYWRNTSAGPLSVTGSTTSNGYPRTGQTVNGWTFYEHQVTGVSVVSLTGAGLIDDVRLYPAGAQMTTYTYEPLIGVTSQSDLNSKFVYYEYDGLNRLLLIKDENKRILKQYDYQYQAIPHQNPIWQVTGATRCKPCAGNASYTTNMQQVEERDNNPNSTTYNQTRWTDTGNPGSCTAAAAWTNTTTAVRCKQVGGNITGEQEQEQRDVNPCSSTYNELRWQVIGTSSNCVVPTYAKLTLENEFGGLTRYANVKVSFYEDQACTIPKNVSNLTIKWGQNQYLYNGNEYYYYDYSTSGISGTSYVLGYNLMTYEEGWGHPMYGYYSNYYYYVLLSDPAYVITY